MADQGLAARPALGDHAAARRLGVLGIDAGVTLREERGWRLTLLIAGRNQVADARRAAQSLGVSLPGTPSFATLASGIVLWAGPEQWLAAANSAAAAGQMRPLIEACRGSCTVVDQSDARALVSISGPRARQTLSKLLAIDLHPKVFKPGDTALTPVAGLPAQIWQVDDAPQFTFAVARSFAGSVWHALTEAAAEYGCAVVE